MNEDQAEEIIDILYKILDKIEGQKRKERASLTPAVIDELTTGAVVPLNERPRAQRYPLRVDPGTIFRSRPGYNWVCPYCNKAILEGDMIIAFQPKMGARTTYAHLSCDDEEREFLTNLE